MTRIRSSEAVEVVGLADFQKALRAVAQGLPRELSKANKAAAEVVAVGARSLASSLGGVAAKSAPSIKAASEQRAAKVSLGGARYPFALGANFGSQHNVVRNTSHGPMLGWNQFKPFAGKGNDFFLFRTIKTSRPLFMRVYAHQLDELAKRAFPDGSRSAEVS